VACLGLALAGCSGSSERPLIAQDGSARAAIEDLVRPGERQAAQRAADDAKCRELGFKPGTDAFGNCRLKLEQIRASDQPVQVIVR
jgi:hypothetical protein